MTEHYYIKNGDDKEKLFSAINIRDYPFKVAIQDGHDKRTLNSNAYLWLIYTIIADYTGHTPIEIHESYKRMFLIEYCVDRKGLWCFRVKSTKELTTVQIATYIEQVRSDALIDMG